MSWYLLVPRPRPGHICTLGTIFTKGARHKHSKCGWPGVGGRVHNGGLASARNKPTRGNVAKGPRAAKTAPHTRTRRGKPLSSHTFSRLMFCRPWANPILTHEGTPGHPVCLHSLARSCGSGPKTLEMGRKPVSLALPPVRSPWSARSSC